MKCFIPILVFLCLVPAASAQIQLSPGTVTFIIQPIKLYPVTDYTGANQLVGLQGDLYYLNIRWNVVYLGGTERDIGVTCYLNCPDSGEDIVENCAQYQNCNYVGLTGSHSCTISNPKYSFTLPPNEINNITCKFYDPTNPTLEFKPYPQRTFRPIDYSISVSSVTVTLGEAFNLPINILSLGLLAGNFTVNITDLTQPRLVLIERNMSTTEELVYGEVGRVFPRITFLTSGSASLNVLATSNIDPTRCNKNSDCTHLGTDSECISNKCWKKLENVKITSGKSSLSEFGWLGLLQILVLAVLVYIR